MQKEIESAIFSNVGNRLTQELAIGLVMVVMQVVGQAVEAARAETSEPPADPGAGQLPDGNQVAPAAAPVGSLGETSFVAPGYARQDDQAPAAHAAPARPRRASKPTTPKKARR